MARGSISKHTATDGTVTWRIRVDVPDPLSGQRRQRQRTFPTRRAAEAGLHDWLHDLEHGTLVERSTRTAGAYLDWWLDACAAQRVKPTTLASYQHIVRTYLIPVLGAVPLQRLTPAHLQSCYAQLLARGGAAGAPLGPRSVRYGHSILHNALGEALRLGLVARNVAEAVTPPRPPRHEARAWSIEEVQRFLAAARDDPYWPVWLLALHTGLRRSELLGLSWSDVDLDAGRVQVRRSLVVAGSHTILQDGAKRGGHTLALDAASVLALRQWRGTQRERRLLWGPQWDPTELVFSGALGGPLHPNTLGRHFRALARQAECSPLTFHGLRHTHATILMLQGVHPKVVSERLGHADVGITLRTYSHVLPQMHAAAAEIFAAAVDGPGSV